MSCISGWSGGSLEVLSQLILLLSKIGVKLSADIKEERRFGGLRRDERLCYGQLREWQRTDQVNM